MLDPEKTWFVGVDTHKHEHTACAIDVFHHPQFTMTISTRPQQFPAFLDELFSAAPGDVTLVFGLEDTRGLGRGLAQWLVRQGFEVREVNPVYTDRERAHGPDPDKSDPRDAEAIASILFRKRNELPSVRPDGRIAALKQLVSAREHLIEQRTAVKNRLHAALHQQYPGYEKFFSDTFGVAARAFFHCFPSPAELKHYGVKRLGSFLKKHASNLGEKKARRILSQVNKSASRDECTELGDFLIPKMIEQLDHLDEQLAEMDQRMEQYVQDGPYQLSTMPGLGTVLAAIFEAEIGDIANFPSADQLARLSGIAPAEDSSGTRRRRRHRQYGRRRLNKAFYLLALNQITRRANGKWGNAEAGRYFEKKLAEGKSKKHALRCLMRRLVDIIYAMMRDRSAYRMPGEPTAKISWWEETIERLASTKRPSASISETGSAGAAGQSEP